MRARPLERVTVKVSESGCHAAVTRRLPAVDARLIAIARGEVEPDDPFGGLEPAYEEMIPKLMLREDELVGFSDDPRHGFLLCQIDGRRSIADIADACGLGLEQTLAILGDLAERGALAMA